MISKTTNVAAPGGEDTRVGGEDDSRVCGDDMRVGGEDDAREIVDSQTRSAHLAEKS